MREAREEFQSLISLDRILIINNKGDGKRVICSEKVDLRAKRGRLLSNFRNIGDVFQACAVILRK